ncbi:MAG: ATP-dependent helicase HrpB [Hyphomicrobiales bacterium]
MDTLPIEEALPRLDAALAGAMRTVLVAPPGAGKTTRVPVALLDAPWLDGRIVMLEPRRLAARAAAARMAEMLAEAVGERVGYTVRFERKVSSRMRIEVVTEGVLTRRLQADPELAGVGLLIFDEFHERSIDGDLGLALALDIQRALRQDLRMLVMSATLDERRLSAHLGGAPIISAEGRAFPVETTYADRPERRDIAAATARAILRGTGETRTGILAFLPGEAEIRRCARELATAGLPPGMRVLPLYGAMPLSEQLDAIRPAQPGQRKIVLATTIAETSLTIEGIDTVIDSGYKRVPRFDPASGMSSLATVRVSQASADQRRGRAGRLGPGRCMRLWPEAETKALRPHDTPEIFQADPAPLALELAAWGVADPAALAWVDAPPAALFAQARDLLRSLDAIDEAGRITAAGKAMALLPLHPRLSHMLIAGKELGAGARAVKLAALLSERDILPRENGADLALRFSALEQGRGGERLRQAVRQIKSMSGIAQKGEREISLGLLVALAWPDRIAQARGAPGRYLLAGGGGASLPIHDPLAREKWLAVALTDGAGGDQRILLAAPLTLEEIERHFADHISERDVITWDHREEAIRMARERKLGPLTLAVTPPVSADPAAVADAMIAGIRNMGLGALPWTDAARSLVARVRFTKRLLPSEPWPDLSDAALLSTLDEWLKPYVAGMTRRSNLERLDMASIIERAIPPALRSRLDRIAPSHIQIPSGAHVPIDYGTGDDPILRARLQEMFGLMETPLIGEGRAKLRIELLSPARRPVAVTQDLASFWTNAYPHVRSEMRGRYPKHQWPEDPLAAEPVKPGKVR